MMAFGGEPWTSFRMRRQKIALAVALLILVPGTRLMYGFVRDATDELMAAYPLRQRPSTFPDFRSFTNLSHLGNASPEAAFETLQFRMHRQMSEPLTITIQKEIWDLPGDFGDPNVRYSVNLGQAGGPETGYRIWYAENIATNQVRLIIDYETARGGTRRQRYTMVQREGSWRLAVGIIRQ